MDSIETLVSFANTIEPAKIAQHLLNVPVQQLSHLMVGAHNVNHNAMFDEVAASGIPQNEQCDPMDQECLDAVAADEEHWV